MDEAAAQGYVPLQQGSWQQRATRFPQFASAVFARAGG